MVSPSQAAIYNYSKKRCRLSFFNNIIIYYNIFCFIKFSSRSMNFFYIDDAGLSETTSLTHLLDKYARDDNIEEVNLIKHSPFYSEAKFTQLLKSKAGLSVLNLTFKTFLLNLMNLNYLLTEYQQFTQ